jgi:hypothetical protein
MASYSSAPTGRPTIAARSVLKLQPFIRKAVANSFDDIECHADAWVLPTPLHEDFFSQSRRRFMEHQFECKSPSPLMHDMSEGFQTPYTDSLSSSNPSPKRSNGEGRRVERSSSIPIPKRSRKHRRTDSEIMIRLTDSEFEIGPDGRVLLTTGIQIRL